MSITDQYDDDELDDDQPDESSVIKGYRKTAREQAKEITALREQVAQAAVLEKENNLYKANLGDLNEHQQAAVLATAKEITAEALRSQAELLGFVAPPEPTVPTEDLAAFDRVADAVAGGGVPDAASYDAEIKAARTQDEVLAVMAKYGSPVATYD